MLNNHNLFGADLDRFILPPPRGVSEELRKWLTEVCDLDDIAVRLIRLKGLKAQLAPLVRHNQHCIPCDCMPGWLPGRSSHPQLGLAVGLTAV